MIVHAKYVSDLQELPGVAPVSVPGPNGAMAAWGLGAETFLAARDGKQVFVLSADSSANLAALAQSALPKDQLKFKPEVDVPMFLDRWDKYGFRFYYGPQVPEGKSYSTYDKNTEFEWSEKNQTGIQVWDPVYEFDVAQGLTARNDIGWAADAARAHKLPLGMNLSTNNQVWLEDWFPEEMAQQMPEFLGAYYNGPMQGEDGSRFLSWNSTIGEDFQLGALQQDVLHFNKFENLTSWLEPHGEMGHGDTDFMMEYGPVADKTFRQWLQDKYKDVATVSQRWTGKADGLKTWEDVHVPEMATFCGWSPDALDLTGTWKVDYFPTEVKKDQPIAYPNETFAASYDDSSWPDVTAPGDAHALFLPKFKPAVYRRTFNVDGAWLKAHPRVWLYVFDLNKIFNKDIVATLNGKEIGRSPVLEPTVHRDWYEATGALHEGPNTLALGLPSGYLAYRVYLSGVEPKTYPYLGPQLNAMWADFADWAAWSRIQKVQRGMEMIRQVDPDRGIIMMSPGPFFGGEQALAKKYGGDFHDTGGMGGWWNTYLPELMTGVGLPVSVEPSQPAHNVDELHGGYGRWSTEGIQALDYFLQLGDIFWDDAIRADFESNLKLWKLIGKYHVLPPQYAMFYSGRNSNLVSFPWNHPDKNGLIVPGYVPWDWHDDRYPGTAGVCENEFLDGGVNQYKVIIDCNSTILDQDMIDAIGNYVKQGGIFVTYIQTGRHSSTVPNSWPISQLTGYSVTSIDPFPDNGLETGGSFDLAQGQKVFNPATWNDKLASGGGLHLKKVAPDCQDLLVWKDGSIAAGMRPLGKGYIIHLGAKWDSVGWGETGSVNQVMDGILDFAKIPMDPIRVENVALATSVLQRDAPNRGLIGRHFLSNNGLYDVFSFWNSNKFPMTADVVFHEGNPTTAIRVKTGESVPIGKTEDGLPALKVALDPNDSASFITPRSHLELASRAWFDLQREWWKGTATPPAKKLPSFAEIHKDTLPLNEDWVFKPITDQDKVDTLVAPEADDSAWQKRDFAAQLVPLPPPNTAGQTILYRKKFTVPANWNKGPTTLWLTQSEGDAIIDTTRIYCDGSLIKPNVRNVLNEGFEELFKPGSTHVLAMEVQSKSCLIGNVGNLWLYYRPDATEQMELAGEFESSDDGIRFDRKVTLPGAWDTYIARAVVNIPASHAKQTVLMHFDTSGRMSGVVINGRWISQSHVQNCPEFDLNLTPWIKFGEDNKVELIAAGRGQMTVKKISLDFYDPGTYP